ncbi:hypothetical protein OPV22_026613 [Ensete ventricosum]|uniref:Uncharacterized protein n=1 Tax=Ensete ventricosum TaxID=4639 RepID=A0AAV8QD50_ENSVE|nr:hypothetical protein OPV22_026613 [Ensete ventricosum]
MSDGEKNATSPRRGTPNPSEASPVAAGDIPQAGHRPQHPVVCIPKRYLLPSSRSGPRHQPHPSGED